MTAAVVLTGGQLLVSRHQLIDMADGYPPVVFMLPAVRLEDPARRPSTARQAFAPSLVRSP